MRKYFAGLMIVVFVTGLIYFSLVTKQKTDQMFKSLIPEADGFEQLSGQVYRAYNGNTSGGRETLGYVTRSTAMGYAGSIEVATFFDQQGTIKNVFILQHTETPSFFSRVLSADYLEQFKNKKADQSFSLGQDIDGVSRATFTSRGIAAAVRKGAHELARAQLGLSPPPDEKRLLSTANYLLLALLLVAFLFYKLGWSKLRYLTLAAGVVFIGFWQKSPLSLGNIASVITGSTPILGEVPFWLLLLLGVIVLILITGRNLYCYWLCPFGGLAEAAGKLGSFGQLTYKPCERRVKQLRNLRLVLAWLALVVSLFLLNPGISSYEVFAPLFAQEGNAAQWLLVPFMLFTSIFIYRFWCRFFCPVGAILDLIQKVRGSVVSWVTGKKGKTKRKQETPSSLSSSAAGP